MHGDMDKKPAVPAMAWTTHRRLTVTGQQPGHPGDEAGTDEVEVLRQLEDDILASATSVDADHADDAHWHNRIMAVAAFKTVGARRRAFEDEILSGVVEPAMSSGWVADPSVAVSGSKPGGAGQGGMGSRPHVTEATEQEQEAQISDVCFFKSTPTASFRGVSPPPGAPMSVTACSSFKSLGFLSKEDEDEMESIMGSFNGQ